MRLQPMLELLTRGLVPADKWFVGVLLGMLALVTLVWVARRLWR